jgi:hypothetical protein
MHQQPEIVDAIWLTGEIAREHQPHDFPPARTEINFR